ncbi:MAG TPA: hypothetical protein PLC86_23415 [Candidatus Accumulibacter phosphatis]|nr:hypothetical protein [Candidatus Accumulibacter phosphatis]
MRNFVVAIGLIANVSASALETYKNPIDGRDYVADRWSVHTPAEGTPKAKPAGKVQLLSARLLNDNSTLEANVTVEVLAKISDHVLAATDTTASTRKDSGEILVQVDISAGSMPRYRIAHRGEISKEFLVALNKELPKGPDYRSKVELISMQLQLAVASP